MTYSQLSFWSLEPCRLISDDTSSLEYLEVCSGALSTSTVVLPLFTVLRLAAAVATGVRATLLLRKAEEPTVPGAVRVGALLQALEKAKRQAASKVRE
jgi:hypothetical protein